MKIINNKLNYPLVVKYIYGERGNDVYTDINNKEYLLQNCLTLLIVRV